MIKKKIIAFFVIIALFIIPVSVFADVPIPEIPYGAWQYWVVAQSYGEVYLFSSRSPILVDVTADNRHKLFFASCKSYKFIDNQWVYDREWSGQVETGLDTIYASNHNIAYKDGSGFFFTPPKVSDLYQIVRQAIHRGDFGMIWKIFLDGLIPLAGLLILGISLRKGWKFLQNQLMR